MGVLDKFDLHGKTALITGGSRGIGKSVAEGFAQAGADIAIIARGSDEAKKTAEELRKYGTKVQAFPCDITAPSEVERMVEEVKKKFGTIDILVNNAGTAVIRDAIDMSYSELVSIIDLNLTSLFVVSQKVAKVMKEQGGGSIINTASMSAHVVNTPQPSSNYNASKAAVVQLTKNLAVEWAPFNIRVNCISPGYIMTELAKSMKEWHEKWIPKIPQGRMAGPEELQGAYLYFASDASSYATGSDLIIDGGYTLW
jgi:NAD(P)-dependent dehydrogenase (short-subunit alcohol dehydrogenase family)